MSLDKSDLEKGVLGVWWLEANPQQQLHGQLSWDSKEGAALSLTGSFGQNPFDNFNSFQTDSLSAPNVYEPQLLDVFGEVNGTLITVSMARTAKSSLNWTAGYLGSTSEMKSRRVFIGGHLSVPNLASISRYELRSDEYSEWINRTGIQLTIEGENSAKARTINISGHALELFEIGDVSDFQISLGHRISVNQRDGHPSWLTEQNAFIFSTTKPLPLERYREQAFRLHDIVSIAAGHYLPQPRVSLRVTSGNSTQSSNSDIELIEAENETLPNPATESWIFKLGDAFTAEDLVRWLGMSDRFRYHVRRLLITRHSAGMFMEDKLNNVAAVLQGLGRDLSKVKDQKMIPAFKAVFSSIDENFKTYIPSLETWSKTLSKRRNDLAHHDSKAQDTEMTLYLALYSSSYWLGLVAILTSIGISSSAIERLLGNQSVRYELGYAHLVLSSIASD